MKKEIDAYTENILQNKENVKYADEDDDLKIY